MHLAAIDLSGVWQLTADILPAPISIDIPGDVYSALLAHKVLPDPFYADNELQWVAYAQHDWQILRTLTVSANQYRAQRIILDIAVLDTIAEVYINRKQIAASNSMFIPLCVDVKQYLCIGENELTIRLRSAQKAAAHYAKRLPYPIPHTQHPVQSPHRNLIRKAQCHGGWDWGPALMTAGVYRSIRLRLTERYAIQAFHCTMRRNGLRWSVTVHIDIDSTADIQLPISVAVANTHAQESYQIRAGLQEVTLEVVVENPQLWWPFGHGGQPQYTLALQAGELKEEKQIAFRTVEIENGSDRYGKALRFVVNGRPILITGANWIPCDALPSRQTDRRIAALLESARAVHINMLRVWGGGQYESDYFYHYCSTLGILVWQDFMFSCSLYPADPSFLALVRTEARAQVKRLKDFPCLALWCGNNENLGAMNWFPESVKNRDVYLVDYDRLNEGVLGDTVRAIDPQRPFWPSSPCGGPNDYSANWHADDKGDMHFWSVWHEGKSFEAYYSVVPRFCSEFGFQSFPSIQTARSFVPPEALNPTHPQFEHHQRHPNGNRIIIETIGRYFLFPRTFENIIYLSQLQQGLAIQTAVEYWRFHAQRCAGMMYWQLNDLWPGASWSSLEYNGNWKLLHYMARRFYRPLHIAAFRDPRTHAVLCALYNSHPRARDVTVVLSWYRGDGHRMHSYQCDATVEPQSTHRIEFDDRGASIDGDAILHMQLIDEQKHCAENLFLYSDPKCYSLPTPRIIIGDITPHSVSPPPYFPNATATYALSVVASDIALYVSIGVQEQFGNMSDNAFFLRPNTPATVLCYVDGSILPDADRLRQQLQIFTLAHSSA